MLIKQKYPCIQALNVQNFLKNTMIKIKYLKIRFHNLDFSYNFRVITTEERNSQIAINYNQWSTI